MRLKSFYAKTMKEAMNMVRDTLGEDAVIVATREEQGGKVVRVTAAIDPSDYNDDTPLAGGPAFETHGREEPTSSQTWLQYDDEQYETAVAEDITDAMLRHAVPEDVMDQILSCVTIIGFDDTGIALIAAIEHLFNFTPLPEKSYKKAIMLVGPPGSGKTLAAAKIAARGTMKGLNVGVISSDTIRAGGIEQLQSFTNLLNIDLQKAETPSELSNVAARLSACHQTVIDTAGINPFDPESVKDLARLIGATDVEPYLVLPGGIDAEEAGEMARVFATIGVHKLIPSRVDISRRLGGILSAAHQGGMSLADASNTSQVANGFLSLNPKNLAKLLLPSAIRDEDTQSSQGALDKSAQRNTKRRSKAGIYQ